jgi:regulatory protein
MHTMEQGDERSGRRQGQAEKPLLARALALLARREHSRLQLRRKLAPFAESAEELERLLDRLQQENLLSDARFAEGVARRRSERLGALRIAQELKQQGIEADLQRPILARLQQTEMARARALWQRRFGSVATDPAGRARQIRFLRQRGFAADIVQRIAGGRDDDD